MGLTMQCNHCTYQKKNSGLVVPVAERAFFCLATEAIRDAAVALILEPLILERAQRDQCPRFDPGVVTTDSYVAEDR